MEELGDSSDSTACLLLGLSAASQHAAPSDHAPTRQQALASTTETSGSPLMRPAEGGGVSGDRRSQVAALPRKEWNEAEDALIKHGVERLGCRWRVIAAMLPGRSDDAVRNRWSRLQDSYRGSSGKSDRPAETTSCGCSAAVDAAESSRALPASGATGGPGATNGRGGVDPARKDSRADGRVGHPPSRSNSKSSKACSKSAAADNGDHGNGKGAAGSEQAAKKERTSWTRSEDDVIMQGVAELGHKWYEIARRLPGRTDHAIRNRWSRLQSIMQESAGHAVAVLPTSGIPHPKLQTSSSLLRSTSIDGSVCSMSVDQPPHADAPAASAKREMVDPPATGQQTSASEDASPVSLAGLSTDEPSSLRQDMGVETTNSDASEATLAVGTAELLLLQSTPSCHASPLISSTPGALHNGNEIPEASLSQAEGISNAASLLILNKRARVADN
ncbi:hypothetical protein AB1Y20_001188 [Prymnesium parvum]|uniref:Uncharacterized protein n=1 Tax=Prymnesium parvum TaxID=97485 RepID=A0AB34KB99_PRYPA